MSVRDAYKKKAEAELELAQARVAEFKAKVKSFTATLTSPISNRSIILKKLSLMPARS